MNEIAFVAAAALAAVFAWAGGRKLAKPGDTAAGLRSLRVANSTLVARGLPPLEFGIALALLAVPAAGAVLALVALSAFSAVLLTKIRAGVNAPCACFGATSPDPVSSVDLVRNALLAALAVAALFAPGPQLPSVEAVIVVSCAVVAGLLVLSLCRLHRDTGSVWSNAEAREGVRP